MIFTIEMKKRALEANGWHALWHPDYWVHEKMKNPDWEGYSLEEAFVKLLKEKNVL